MRTFQRFPEKSKCPICGTNEDKECVLIGIHGTQEGHNMEAQCYHLDCIELIQMDKEENTLIVQMFKRKDK